MTLARKIALLRIKSQTNYGYSKMCNTVVGSVSRSGSESEWPSKWKVDSNRHQNDVDPQH
jgi:hypothetical protein